MLNEAKLSNGYWREVVSMTVYILNRGQIRINNNKTPYKLWYGRAPSVKYFKFFGSKCYIKRVDENLRKFDARSNEGIFLGYSPTQKEYKCYNLRLHKIIESSDVKVDDLKTKKLKYQETVLDSEDEDNDELVDIQADIEEKEETQEDEMDTREEEEDIQEEEIKEEPPRRDIKTPSRIIQRNHLEDLIIGNKSTGVQTRKQLLYQTKIALLSHIEPGSIKEACKDENWVKAMNE